MKHQLSLAILLPEIESNLSAIQSKLTSFGVPLNLVKLEHCALETNYLGKISDEDLKPILKKLQYSIKKYSPYNVTFDHIQVTYSRHEPTQVYLSVPKLDFTYQMQLEIAEILRELEVPQPTRFEAKLVLATLPRTDPPTTKHFIDTLSDYDLPSHIVTQVSSLHLIEQFNSKRSIHLKRFATFQFHGDLH